MTSWPGPSPLQLSHCFTLSRPGPCHLKQLFQNHSAPIYPSSHPSLLLSWPVFSLLGPPGQRSIPSCISPALCSFTSVLLHFINSLAINSPELPRTSVFSSFIRLRQKSQPWVSLMISFLQDFTLQVKKRRKSPARKRSPLLIRGPYEALPSDPATPGWSLTTLNSLNLEPMRCLSVSHLIFMWWSCFYTTEKAEAVRGGLLRPPVTKFTRTCAHLSLFLQKRVTVFQPGASKLPGGHVETYFLDLESTVLTITWGNFRIPEEEHGHPIKDVVQETPLQMLENMREWMKMKKWENTWNSWSDEQNKMISKQIINNNNNKFYYL